MPLLGHTVSMVIMLAAIENATHNQRNAAEVRI